jgi:hypothetical protein
MLLVLFLLLLLFTILELLEEKMRGRVMSFYAMALMGTQPIGNLILGAVASGIGVPITILLGGVVTFIGGIIWRYFSQNNLYIFIGIIH